MAPLSNQVADLAKRYYYSCNSYYANGTCRSSAWWSWGRWVMMAIIIVVFFLVLLSCGCVNSRRRRRNGMAPRYGTGWMAPAPKYENNPNTYNNYAPPPPQYSAAQQPQYTGTTFSPNEGYYGNQNNNYPQQPSNTYQRGVDGFEAPPGPPPAKAA